MSLFSIKMRASQHTRHISGAERILSPDQLSSAVSQLTERALHHSLGQPDSIQLKLEEINHAEIQYIPALPVSALTAASAEEGENLLVSYLETSGIPNGRAVLELLHSRKAMRGAILYDITSQTCREPDPQRGVRVTYMDSTLPRPEKEKCHFHEALILASKTAHAPGMLAELCISDDPDYVTGYIASSKLGYVRISPLKKEGCPFGGRVFIFDSRKAAAAEVIAYLEKQPVLITDMPQPPRKLPADWLAEELARIQSHHLYRQTQTISSPQTAHVQRNGKNMLLLSSNAYLDLANHPEVKQAAALAALTCGTGSGGSRLTTGTMPLHEELETRLAQFKHTESALLFNTGYTANLGTIAALSDRDTIVFSDEYNHASIIDGCRLGKGRTVIYRHLDMNDLEEKIKANPCKKGLIVSDAVFSMDGDILDLPAFTAIGKRYRLLTMVDEAHSTGVLGKTGRGITEYFPLAGQPDIIMGTLSKSLGSEGGFICASSLLISYLKNKARSFIFSTAQTPPTLAAALASLDIIEREPERIACLHHNIRFFCQALAHEGVPADSQTAIIPIPIGDEKLALQIAADLQEQGFLIPAIRYPTVPKGTARLRSTVMATHTEEELMAAAAAIGAAIRRYLK